MLITFNEVPSWLPGDLRYCGGCGKQTSYVLAVASYHHHQACCGQPECREVSEQKLRASIAVMPRPVKVERKQYGPFARLWRRIKLQLILMDREDRALMKNDPERWIRLHEHRNIHDF